MAVAKVMADAKVTSILEDLDTEIEERYYSIRTNEKLELSVKPHPRNGGDILGCKGERLDDFEESLNDHENCWRSWRIKGTCVDYTVPMEW